MRVYGLLLMVVTSALVACSSEIGDACSTTTDCSPRADRLCDRAQPKGYCTVRDCEANGCPDSAVCVEYRYSVSRFASTWCMARCSEQDDCRDDRSSGQGYACVHASDLGEGVARVVDTKDRSFCAAVPLLPE